MRRITQLTVLTFAALLLTTSSVQACCIPYIPWLDPFAWLGFYGCGGGCGCYGGYQQPVYGGYQQPIYSGAYVPQMNYQVAQTPSCGCTAAVAQPQYSAVQVPVTTYQPVTQYVPRTTYRTEYRPQVASVYAGSGYYSSNIAYSPAPVYSGAPVYSASPSYQLPAPTAYGTGTPATAYDANPGGTVIPSNVYPSNTFLPPAYSQPMPMGDVAGDHEYPSQSAVAPQLYYQHRGVPVRPASYGVTPQAARTFSAAVR